CPNPSPPGMRSASYQPVKVKPLNVRLRLRDTTDCAASSEGRSAARQHYRTEPEQKSPSTAPDSSPCLFRSTRYARQHTHSEILAKPEPAGGNPCAVENDRNRARISCP